MRFILFIAAIFLSASASAAAAQFSASKVVFQDVTGAVNIKTTSGDVVDVTIRQGEVYRSLSVKMIDGALVIAGERGYLGSNARLLEYGGMIAIGAVSVFAAISAAEPVPGLHFALLSLPL